MLFEKNEEQFMQHALNLGKRGQGRTWPNPSVGCVIVNNNRIVGRGWTQDGGSPHAETVALEHAGDAALNAIVYVTLEPCAHHGKTSPCADRLIAAGIRRVVSAIEDPDPRVSGKGHRLLENTGIDVTSGCLSEAASRQHRGFILRKTKKRPAVTLKLAKSIDGKVATRTGQSKWITGKSARKLVHILRSSHDAIMVGIGTVLADDPKLNVRIDGISQTPVRVIVDSSLKTPVIGQLAKSASDIPLWICHSAIDQADQYNLQQNKTIKTLECSSTQNGQVDLSDALEKIACRGINTLFCEGGSKIAASLLKANLVDTIYSFTSGLIMGKDGISSIGPLGIDLIPDTQRFVLKEIIPCGNDVACCWIRD